MAKIIPQIDLNTIKHSSERIIYEAFMKLGSKTEGWIIYYSYNFKRRNKILTKERNKIHDNSEIDFLILAPNLGIFVFEIKGGRITVCDDKIYSINKDNFSFEINPYKQAKDNFYSLKTIIEEITNYKILIDRYVYGLLVGFPDISKVPSVGPQSNGRDTYVDGMDLYKFIINNSNLSKQDSSKIVPSKEDINNIVKALSMTNATYTKDAANYIKSINLSINDLTDEQTKVFKGLQENKRCLIEGGAGTGKTVLCQFLYKNFINQKKSVIYFTYNKLIAHKINSEFSETNSNCYPIYEYLENQYKKIDNINIPNFGDDFEKKKSFLLENINNIYSSDELYLKKYDCLIIDEAQDIDGNDEMMLFLDNLLNDGLENGYCYIFYDKKQTIFESKKLKIFQRNEFIDYRYTKFSLEVNCRNSSFIASSISQIIDKKIDQLEESQYYSNDYVLNKIIKTNNAGLIQIIKAIDELLKENVAESQITILFNRKPDNNNFFFSKLKEHYKKRFNEFDNQNSNISYSTISKFKGLENDVIIYINDNEKAKYRNHYVAISRARAKVYIFIVRERGKVKI